MFTRKRTRNNPDTPPHARPNTLMAATGVAALFAMVLVARAYPPPGGGGTGGGTIYFTYAGVLNTMNSDGSNKTPLPVGVLGEPSYALHGPGSARWFLHITNGELFAMRGDGTLDVQLTNSFDGITLPDATRTLAWAKDDLSTPTINEADFFVSFLGSDAFGTEAIYRAGVAFDTAGIPSVSSPAEVIVVGAGIYQFDWAPDGVRVVYRQTGPSGTFLNIANVGGATQLLTDGSEPAWSPSGTKIAFRTNPGYASNIGTINPDGSGRTTIISGHGGMDISVFLPKWSPGSTHLIYARAGGFGSNVAEVYRATANGGQAVNLTNDLPTTFFNPARPVAWR